MLKKSENSLSLFTNMNISKLVREKQSEIEDLQNKLDFFNSEKTKLKAKFGFIVPDYIIDEILGTYKQDFFTNLNVLINCAVVSGELSKENAMLLKQCYLF